jgi:hypothetical protein
VHVRSTSRSPIRLPREMRVIHLPPQGGKAKEVAKLLRLSLFPRSQFIAIQFLGGEG